MVTEAEAIAAALRHGYEVSMYGTLIVRPLEDGRFALDVVYRRGDATDGTETFASDADAAARWMIATRTAKRLGPRFEVSP